MQKLLLKKILRNKKDNFRYFSLFILVLVSMYLVLSVMGDAWSVIVTVNENAQEKNVEDGTFSLFIPLTNKEKTKLKRKGIDIQENFYLDFHMDGDSVIRCYKNRNEINQITVVEGKCHG